MKFRFRFAATRIWRHSFATLMYFLGHTEITLAEGTKSCPFFFCLISISWRLITLQYCSGFCHTLTWISHGFTCVPHPKPPSCLPPHPIPLGLPSAPALSTCLMHPTCCPFLSSVFGLIFQTCDKYLLRYYMLGNKCWEYNDRQDIVPNGNDYLAEVTGNYKDSYNTVS